MNYSRTLRTVARTFSRRQLSTAAPSEIEVKEEGSGVFHVKLNRPQRRNAYTLDLWKETKTVFDRLSDEPKCRAIVLSGNGKSFCAGIDLQMGLTDLISILQDDSVDVGRRSRALRRVITICQDGFTSVEKCEKPVIAAVHSHCIGGAIDLITACDIRYASKDSVFSIKEVDIGLAADVGTLARIQKLVGNDSWTRELAFTARDFGVDEAFKHGMISRIYPDRKTVVQGALDVARTIAEKSPIAVQGTKIVLNHARNSTTDESLNFVKTWNQGQLLSSDLMNSAMAAMQKQKPEFEDV